MPITPTRGRWYVLGWVAVFLAVAGIVTLRDRRAFAMTKAVETLDDSLRVLLDVHTSLSAEMRTLLSPGEVTRRGEALGLRLPSDSEIRTLRIPGP